MAGSCGCVSVSAETVSGLKAILGGLSLGRGIPFPRCRLILDKTGPNVVAKPAIGALSRLRFGLRGDRFWLRLRRSSLLVENGDAPIFPASPRDHIAAVRTISTNELPVSPQATQARIGILQHRSRSRTGR